MVGDLLQGLLKKHPAFSANPVGDWSEIAGEQLARYSEPVSLKKKVLVVVAYDSVYKHHLELNKNALIDKINCRSSEPLVEKIVIKVGELTGGDPVLNANARLLEKMGAKGSRAKKKKKTPPRPLTPDEKALLKTLTDPELRRIGERLLKHLPAED